MTRPPRPRVRPTGVDPPEPGSSFPFMVRIGGLKSAGGGGGVGGSYGPAFVRQVFCICDITGTGLMAVSTHVGIPFISKRCAIMTSGCTLWICRTPEWIKKMFSAVMKNESGPVFRFFMDLGDAVSHVRRLNIS